MLAPRGYFRSGIFAPRYPRPSANIVAVSQFFMYEKWKAVQDLGDGKRLVSGKREAVQNQENERCQVKLKGPTPEELRSQSQSMLSYWLR